MDADTLYRGRLQPANQAPNKGRSNGRMIVDIGVVIDAHINVLQRQ
jgi:hypothetical protein